MTETLLEQARRAVSEEQLEDAQAILINVIASEPENEQAWLLLAEVLSDPGKKRECLERARTIIPRNRAILRALERLDGQAADESGREPSPAPSPPSISSLLSQSEELAQTLLRALNAPEARAAGVRLLAALDEASACDAGETRRWARSAGRLALSKYEKILTAAISGLPYGHPDLPELREERLRAMHYLQ